MVLSIEGLEKLWRKLSPERLKDPAVAGLKRITLKLEGLIKKSTVVDTGRLRASIRHSFGESSAIIGTSVEYARFVEYGTRPHFPPFRALKGWARRHNANEAAVWWGIGLYGTKSGHMEGSIKVRGEGGSFQYGVQHIQDVLNDEERKIAEGIKIEVDKT